MRAIVDSITGRVSMYRLATIALVAVLASGVALGFFDAIGADPYGILGAAGVVIVATLGANEVAARLARVVPHRESSLITALIIACIVPPSLATLSLVGASLAGILAALSKYLIVWRGRHLLNPAATGILFAGLIAAGFGQAVGVWWIGTAALLPVVALGALLLLDRTHRLDVGLVFLLLALVIIGVRLMATGSTPWGAATTILQLFPVVFLAGFMLSEPLTLPPRRWQQWLTAAVVAVSFSIPFSFGPLYNSPELALVLGNVVAFAVSRRPGFAVRVLGSGPLSASATEYRFAPTRPVHFEAGQYLELHLPHPADRRGMRRIFSIASAPERAIGDEPQLTIGMRTPSGGSSFKAALARLEPGTQIAATQVSGEFVLPRSAAIPLVMLAGGIGITPFASQLASLTARGEQRDIVVVVIASTPGEMLYRETLETSGARLVLVGDPGDAGLELGDEPGRWTVIDGPLSAEALTIAVPDIATRRGMVSGAPAVVVAGRRALRQAGVRRVHTDYFAGY